MTKTIINTAKGTEAVGPYSQAVKVGNILFVSGQIPLEPQSGTLVEGDIESQTMRALENLGAILHAEGLDFRDVVKTTLYIKDMEKFEVINRIYAKYFQQGPPARACVEVSKLPRGAAIEIEAVAAY